MRIFDSWKYASEIKLVEKQKEMLFKCFQKSVK